MLLVLAEGEVIRAEVGEYLAGGEDVPDHVEETVSDRDGGLVRAPAAGYLPVLGTEVAVLGSRGRPGRLDHGAPQPREAGPLVMSRLDYLALQPTSSVSDTPVAVHHIGQCTRRTPRYVREQAPSDRQL